MSFGGVISAPRRDPAFPRNEYFSILRRNEIPLNSAPGELFSVSGKIIPFFDIWALYSFPTDEELDTMLTVYFVKRKD